MKVSGLMFEARELQKNQRNKSTISSFTSRQSCRAKRHKSCQCPIPFENKTQKEGKKDNWLFHLGLFGREAKFERCLSLNDFAVLLPVKQTKSRREKRKN